MLVIVTNSKLIKILKSNCECLYFLSKTILTVLNNTHIIVNGHNTMATRS